MAVRRVQLIWAGICALGIVILGLVAEDEEAQCRAHGDFLCFSSGAAFLAVAVVGGQPLALALPLTALGRTSR